MDVTRTVCKPNGSREHLVLELRHRTLWPQKKSVPQRWLRRVTPLHALVHVPHCVSLVRRKHFSPSTFAVASPASGSDCTGRLLIGQCGYDGDGESGLTILQRAEDWNVKRIGGQSRVTCPPTEPTKGNRIEVPFSFS
jgi:hypothetical protein